MVLKSETMADVDRLVVTILGFFVLNAFIADAIRRMAELYKVRYEAEIIRQQSTLQLAHYNEMIKNYNRYRKVTHDVRKHLATLEGLPTGLSGQPAVENGHYLQYSQTFLNRLELMFDEFECDSHILSIIMTQKLRLSKEHDIKNITRIENVDIGFMDDIDITAMFANLWDNAIEACTELPKEKRFINMYLFTKNDMILIQFENSFNGEITEHSGTYVSAKGGEHAGVGLQIIHDTAQKYGGHFITDVKNNIFTATVMLTRERT
jgi:sensor histidine kinase regulating citrate/malate metabolism